MNDFFVWFLSRHWLVSAVLFPELSFVWAVWMRQEAWAVVMGAAVFVLRGVPLAVRLARAIEVP